MTTTQDGSGMKVTASGVASLVYYDRGSRFELFVGTFQPNIPDYDTATELREAPIVPPSMVSESYVSLFKGTRLLDMGGSGDCFFLCVNAYLAKLKMSDPSTKVFSPDSVYKLLGEPPGTYINDDHLYRMGGIYNCQLVFSRVVDGQLISQVFGEPSNNVVALFNTYPNHYYLSSKCIIQGVVTNCDVAEAPSKRVEIKPTHDIAVFKEDYRDQDLQFSDDPALCEVEEVELPGLYQYVDSRYTIKKQNYALTAADSKMYYKLRHNCFKTAFLDLLNLPSTRERSFREALGIDSDRTPDFLHMTSDSVILVEFTVVKRFETSLKTKQSRSKYQNECNLIGQIGVSVFQFYPTLALDSDVEGVCYDVKSVAEQLDVELVRDPRSVLSNLQESILALESDISELLPELLLNQELTTKVGFGFKRVDTEPLFPTQVRKLGVKRNRAQRVLALIRRNSRSLESFLRRVSYKSHFKVIVNLKTNAVYIDNRQGGASKNLLLTLVQNMSQGVLEHVEMTGGVSDAEEPFKLYGSPTDFEIKRQEVPVEELLDTDVYENYFFNKLMKESKMNEGIHTLAEDSIEKQVPEVESTYLKKLAELRKAPNTIIYDKNYFMFPIATDLSKGGFVQRQLKTGLPITDLILSHITHVNRNEKIISRELNVDKLDSALAKHNKAYYALCDLLNNDRKVVRQLKQLRTVHRQKDILESYGYVMTPELKEKLCELNAAKTEITKDINEQTRTTYSNRVNISRSFYRKHWDLEMEHFSTKKGVVKIASEKDMSELDARFAQLFDMLWAYKSESTSDDIRSNTEPVGLELKNMLTEMIGLVEVETQELKRTQIMHDLEFISRFCYTLLYFSNIKLNKEDFMYDNMGYEDALLIVKGGKKVLSTKKSRLFKLIFPITSEFSWLYLSNYTKKIEVSGKTYVVFPWQTYHFDMLKAGAELYYTFSNYYICSLSESDLTPDLFKKFIFPKVLNMYSQRRKVEIWFGFFRYLYLNSLSSHTSVLKLIEDMVDHDYDPYFYYCQRKFCSGYRDIYAHASEFKIFDIFTSQVFENFDLCAEKFDESLFMTRAPFDRTNEHLKNMRSVLETHQEFASKFSFDSNILLAQTTTIAAEDDYFDKLFSDDLMFDPKLATCIGKFAGQHLSRAVTKSDMAQKFTKIVSDSYTKISTGKGMRSTTQNFWGSKGHEVVFETNANLKKAQEFVSHLPESYKDFNRKLEESHISFADKIESMETVQLEFDMKDKKQWKGSREIYVMTDVTKLLQSPLEAFFKYLCIWTPNELIHKKSHVRPKFIHSQVFEFSEADSVRTFCTLDCRKWAPKSNLWKYYYFVRGMEPYLPAEFCDYFYHVWALMFKKKIRFQKYYVDLMKKNSATSSLVDLLTKRQDGDYEMEMPYSFMMGIFNYLSSLFHAFTQLYFNDKIAQRQGAILNLVAHSDDSGGVIMSNSYNKNVQIFRQYEMYQKAMNHLMSRKKCSLSPKFFELISIMYARERLIPMTHKFLANVSFEPKGKGWVDDISTVVSKVVELFSNGASLLQCYLTMITMGEMIRKFYHIPRIRTLSRIPLAFGGIFNMHPLHLILIGADAQEVMLDVIETPGARSFRIKCYQLLSKEYFPGKGATVNYKIPYYKRHKHSDLFNPEITTQMKIISSCIPGTTLGDILSHYSRIKDSAYIYSLEGVDMAQIYTMTLFTKTMVLMEEREKLADLSKFAKVYSLMTEVGVFTNRMDMDYSQFHNYMKSSEGIKVSLSDINLRSKKTCKPISYSTFESLGLNLDFKTVCEIIAYNSGPEYRFLFPDPSRLEALTFWVKNNLRLKNESEVVNYLMKLTSKDTQKLRSSYCFMPSGINLDTLERFWTYAIFYTTRRYLISNKKPQYFTLDQFKLWSGNYASVKHYYLLLKLAFHVKDQPRLERLKVNSDCPTCQNKQIFAEMLDEVERLKGLGSWQSTQTSLSFATYEESQRHSVNVWFGGSQFTLYSPFGRVRQYKREGETFYEVVVNEEEAMDRLYFLLLNFINTRGIPISSPIYTVNDSGDLKLGFNDLNKPIALAPGSKGIMLRNSVVRVGGYTFPTIKKEEGSNFSLNGSPVDFELYYNYDLNPKFYEDHNLSQIRDLVFEEELVVSRNSVLESMLSSKIYKVLMRDPSHGSYADFDKAYATLGVLGDERSLTRALVIADSENYTKFTSSANTSKIDRSLFEGVSYKDIPVIDLVDNMNFARITYKERLVIQSLIEEKSINESDVMVLDRLVAKMGAKPTFSAITTLKVTFTYLSFMDVIKIDPVVVEEFIYTLTKAALASIDDRPRRKREMQAVGNVTAIANNLAFLVTTNSLGETVAEALTLLYIRAHYDNASSFWDKRKSDTYCALYQPSEKLINAQYLFILACVNRLFLAKLNLTKLLTIRQIAIASRNIKKTAASMIKKVSKYEEPEYLTGRLDTTGMSETNYFCEADDDDEVEEFFDAITGNEDPENFTERSWEGEDEGVYWLIRRSDWAAVAEETLKTDYETLTLYSMSRDIPWPWLGHYDREIVVDKGLTWYRFEYPGHSPHSRTPSSAPSVKVVRKESKPIEILKTQEEGPKVTREDKATVFKLGSEEEVYEYQRNLLESLGFTDINKYSHLFYKYNELVAEETFWNSLSTYTVSKIMSKGKDFMRKKMRSSILPGFTGNLQDPTLRAELNALFNNHSEELVTGNHIISESSRRFILRSLKRIYKNSDETVSGIIVLLAATLKDAIVVEDASDSWYTDSLMSIMDWIEEKTEHENKVYKTAPRPKDSSLTYTRVFEYDSL